MNITAINLNFIEALVNNPHFFSRPSPRPACFRQLSRELAPNPLTHARVLRKMILGRCF